MPTRTAIRWSDNDRYFGPFTYARERGSFKRLAITFGSGDDGDYPHCRILFAAFGHTLIARLPQIIQPYRKKVFPTSWDSATIERLGRNWYYDTHEREFGFTYSEGHLSVKYGRQTHDSSTGKTWGCFLPWTQWRHVRHTMYGLALEPIWTQLERKKGQPHASDDWWAAKEACPSVTFAFADFDGERLTAKTIVEEREWRFGQGWFRWLSLFCRSRVRRSLDIRFSGETGKRKGSWKGGTLGHGITMLPNEIHDQAFRRYCAENGMTFEGIFKGAAS